MSPLVIFARSGWMPLPALYLVAAGLAVMLMLVGRRLHAVLLSDALAGRQTAGQWLVALTMMLLGVFLVLLAVAVTLMIVLGGDRPTLPF